MHAAARTLALVAALAAAPHLVAQPTRPSPQNPVPDVAPLRVGWPPEADPAVTSEEAAAWLAEVRPVVEEVLGRELRAMPAVEIVSRAELFDDLVAQAIAERRAIDPLMNESEIRGQYQMQLIAIAPMRLARYDTEAGLIQVPAGNLRPLFDLTGTDEAQLAPIMRLTMARMLAIALLDQEVDMQAQLARARTGGELRAMQALYGGFGLFAQRRVAETMGENELAETIEAILGLRGVADRRTGTARELFNRLDWTGRNALRHHAEQGGLDAVWSVVAAPPPTYAQVAHPKTYGEPVEMERSVPRLFVGIRDRFEPLPWAENAMSLTADEASQTFRLIGSDRVATAAACIERGWLQFMQASTALGDRTRSVLVFKLAGDEGCDETLLGLIDAITAEQFRLLTEGGAERQMEPTTRTADALPGLDAEVVRLEAIEVGEEGIGPTGPRGFQLAVARAKRGPYVVQATVSGGVVEDALLGEVVQTVLDRLADPSTRVPVEPPLGGDLRTALQAAEPFLDGDGWRSSFRAMEQSGLRASLQDEAAILAVDRDWSAGVGGAFERGENAEQTLLLTCVELTRSTGMASLVPALESFSTSRFDVIAQTTGAIVDRGPTFERTTDGGVAVRGGTASILPPEQPEATIRYAVAQRGVHVVTIWDSNGCILEGEMDAMFDAIFAELE